MSHVFISHEGETPRASLLDPMLRSWSETVFKHPEPPRSELLELRNRIVHGTDAVQWNTRFRTSMTFYGGGEAVESVAAEPGARTLKPDLVYYGGSIAICTQVHPDDDHFDVDLVALREEGERWDIDEWSSVFTKLVATSKAFTESASSITSLRKLLRRQARDERIRSLPSERRALYDSIKALREEIGPGEFDINQALREIREGA